MSDKVWQKMHFRRGTKGDQGPPRDSDGNSGVLSGGPGCDHDYDDQNLFLGETPVVRRQLQKWDMLAAELKVTTVGIGFGMLLIW